MNPQHFFGLLLLFLISCAQEDRPAMYLGQGTMSGEITSTSVLLQSRLTMTDTLIDGDVPGIVGVGQFEVSPSDSFQDPTTSGWLNATAENDFILKTKISGLESGTQYYYRLRFGTESAQSNAVSPVGTFKTLPGAKSTEKVSFVVVTGMNHYHFHYGQYNRNQAYTGNDKHLGYPALASILKLRPDYFIGTGDNVYFDHPNQRGFERAKERGNDPHPGGYGGKEVVDETGMRRKYHEQFYQPRYIELFRSVGTYWEKDDHDYRFNDADPYQELDISHELGIKNFREQLPVVDPNDPSAVTYRTHRMSAHLQVWFLEGRDYRSANQKEDGPDKTLLGREQLAWLQETLLASEATFKIIVSPTPMVGPDDAYKTDNHVNHDGFRHEGEAIFQWWKDNGFLKKNLYIICGDRHWQYHAMHPSGFEEFSTGALVDNNSRAGRLAGDPKSTDPDALIEQFYVQGDRESASGGFLLFSVEQRAGRPTASFQFFDEKGVLLYEAKKVGASDD
ncbi:MAG: alkaline phosphatase D family protein [Bacteroidota bacterium]